MAKDLLIGFIRSIVSLSPEEEQLIRGLCTTLRVPAKTFLVQQGELNHSLYFITQGCARIAINATNGEEISCYFAQEMDLIAVYESFLTGQPSDYFIQTVEDTEMLVLDRMGVETIFEEVKEGNLFGRKLNEALTIQTVNRLTDFYRYTPEERFRKFVQEQPRLVARLPQNCVASYIGVKPQSLSRIKKRVFSAE